MDVRKVLCASTAALLSFIPWDSASGQFIPRSFNANRATRDYILSKPTVSPYLNLLRRGSGFGINANYQTLVRPEVERRQQQARQRNQINQIQSRVTNMQGQMVMSRRQRQGEGFSTGHPTRFMYYLHYYPSLMRRR